jgi:hypothetical protein
MGTFLCSLLERYTPTKLFLYCFCYYTQKNPNKENIFIIIIYLNKINIINPRWEIWNKQSTQYISKH